MKMRERLYELIVDAENAIYREKTFVTDTERIEKIADHLLANGVIVPPVKVGDTVYWLHNGVIKDRTVYEISIQDDGIRIHTGIRINLRIKEVFLTKEEAEKALAEMNKEGEG